MASAQRIVRRLQEVNHRMQLAVTRACFISLTMKQSTVFKEHMKSMKKDLG